MSTPTDKTIRLLMMLLENPFGYPKEDIMDRLEIGRSTFYKYLDTIKRHGINVEKEGSFYKIINVRLARTSRNIQTEERLYKNASHLLSTKIKFKKNN